MPPELVDCRAGSAAMTAITKGAGFSCRQYRANQSSNGKKQDDPEHMFALRLFTTNVAKSDQRYSPTACYLRQYAVPFLDSFDGRFYFPQFYEVF